ncbi:MAG TPA: hypothetical protein VMV48_00350 [Gallionellaceae bacterium]|nr:hypothetical protein [Gallionellaceae bacterium]
MSVFCPVSMLPNGGGKAAVFVFAALVVLAIAAAQTKQPATPTTPNAK